MFIPHHSFAWLATLLDHVRFIGALINPFSIRKGVSLARSNKNSSNTAVVEPEEENDSISYNTAARAMNPSLQINEAVIKTTTKHYPGLLIINADDWGRDRENTDRIHDCVVRGTVSSSSAMVFMEDSERAAEIAQRDKVDTGLHLNLTSPFTGSNCPPKLLEEQIKISSLLRRHRLAKIVPHPGMTRSFEYVVASQLDEYRRIYGKDPERLDGHHHMHLCANVLFGKLIPEGIIVRRNFSFIAGEKSFFNRRYREVEDQLLAKRYRMVDFFFSIAPLVPTERLDRLFSLAREHAVELETHPVNPDEHQFLMGDEILRYAGDQPIATRFTLPL